MGFFGRQVAKAALAFTRNIDPGIKMSLVGNEPPYALSPLLVSGYLVNINSRA
jgi:hypothetical protein